MNASASPTAATPPLPVGTQLLQPAHVRHYDVELLREMRPERESIVRREEISQAKSKSPKAEEFNVASAGAIV